MEYKLHRKESNEGGVLTDLGDFVQFLGHVRLFLTPWTAASQAFLSFTISWNLLRLMSIESVMPSNHLILCRPLLLLPSMFPSIRVFSGESALRIRRPKYWSFSFSISPSNEYSGLISFRMDWLDLLKVQRTLKSLLQYRSSKASILRCSRQLQAKTSLLSQLQAPPTEALPMTGSTHKGSTHQSQPRPRQPL